MVYGVGGRSDASGDVARPCALAGDLAAEAAVPLGETGAEGGPRRLEPRLCGEALLEVLDAMCNLRR